MDILLLTAWVIIFIGIPSYVLYRLVKKFTKGSAAASEKDIPVPDCELDDRKDEKRIFSKKASIESPESTVDQLLSQFIYLGKAEYRKIKALQDEVMLSKVIDFHTERGSITNEFIVLLARDIPLLKKFIARAKTFQYNEYIPANSTDDEIVELLSNFIEDEFFEFASEIINLAILHKNIVLALRLSATYLKMPQKNYRRLSDVSNKFASILTSKSIDGILDQELLGGLYFGLRGHYGRKVSQQKILAKITNEKVLKDMFSISESMQDKLNLLEKISDLDFISTNALVNESWEVRHDALLHIKDERVLVHMFENDKNHEVRMLAARRLNGQNGISILRKEYLKNYIEDGKSPAKLKTAEEMHYYAVRYNWDLGCDRMLDIIKSSKCEKGTALSIYWLNGPRFLSQYTDLTIEHIAKDHWELRKEIEAMYLSNRYKIGNIEFDPASYVNEYQSKENNTPIPDEMYIPVVAKKHPVVQTSIDAGNLIFED